jgi:hypothetical protein
MFIQAQKTLKSGKVLTRKFSQISWNLLGSSKDGWIQINAQEIGSTIHVAKSVIPPPKGESKPVITEPKPTPVKQEVESAAKIIVNEPTIEMKSNYEFERLSSQLSKSVIKDHFDAQTPPVIYENNENIGLLRKKLGELYNWDVNKFKEVFNLQ